MCVGGGGPGQPMHRFSCKMYKYHKFYQSFKNQTKSGEPLGGINIWFVVLSEYVSEHNC